jgi:hypothetical protein
MMKTTTNGLLLSSTKHQHCGILGSAATTGDKFGKEAKLSGFNLIKWNQRAAYQPTELQRRLKVENDTFMHRLANVGQS